MQFMLKDISRETFGKYQYGFSCRGWDWSDEDESWFGRPRWFSRSAPGNRRAIWWPIIGAFPNVSR